MPLDILLQEKHLQNWSLSSGICQGLVSQVQDMFLYPPGYSTTSLYLSQEYIPSQEKTLFNAPSIKVFCFKMAEVCSYLQAPFLDCPANSLSYVVTSCLEVSDSAESSIKVDINTIQTPITPMSDLPPLIMTVLNSKLFLVFSVVSLGL